MLRAGLIRHLASGLYSWLPIGMRAMRKVEQLTRELEDEVPFVKEVTSLSNVEFMEGAPPDDILGNRRGARPDIGCFEKNPETP